MVKFGEAVQFVLDREGRAFRIHAVEEEGRSILQKEYTGTIYGNYTIETMIQAFGVKEIQSAKYN